MKIKIIIEWENPKGGEESTEMEVSRDNIASAVDDAVAELGAFQRHFEKEQGETENVIAE